MAPQFPRNLAAFSTTKCMTFNHHVIQPHIGINLGVFISAQLCDIYVSANHSRLVSLTKFGQITAPHYASTHVFSVACRYQPDLSENRSPPRIAVFAPRTRPESLAKQHDLSLSPPPPSAPRRQRHHRFLIPFLLAKLASLASVAAAVRGGVTGVTGA